MQVTKRESNAQIKAEDAETSPEIRIAPKTALLLRRLPKGLMRIVARAEIEDSETKKVHVAMTLARTKINQVAGRRATSKMSSVERPSLSQSRSETP